MWLEETEAPGRWCEIETNFINQPREQVANGSHSQISSHFTDTINFQLATKTSDLAQKPKIECSFFPQNTFSFHFS